MATANTMAAIEAELEECLRSWRNLSDFDRCDTLRCRILEQAAALPITSDAEAAAVLRVALRAAGDDKATQDWGTIGSPEDVHRANIVRHVERYLAGRASA